MDKEITKRVNGRDIHITMIYGRVNIFDTWNDFNGWFQCDEIDNFMNWLDYASSSPYSSSRCLGTNKKFFTNPSRVDGNYIARERIPYIKDIMEDILGSTLYRTVLEIKDDTVLLKEVLNHASLFELDGVYSKIKQGKENYND